MDAVDRLRNLPPREVCEHGSQRAKCPVCELATLTDILRALVDAVRAQDDVLDPTGDLIRAVKDAESWIGK